jgi:glycosyltransferase involved in cell wall biosynthesis
MNELFPVTSTITCSNYTVSVVIPVLNEEESLDPLYNALTEVMRQVSKEYEVIFVDDGSTDGSAAVLNRLTQTDPRVRVIQQRRNFGKADALSLGFAAARYEVVLTLDADLQDDPTEIPRMIQKLDEGFDVVSGWKRKRHDPIHKTWPSKLFNWTVGKTTGLRLHDFNCGFKAYRSEVVKNLHLYGEMHRFIPALAHGKGFKVAEISVTHHARKFGKSKYGIERLLRGLFDLMTVLFLTRYLSKPLHLFGALGLLILTTGMGINTYLVALKIGGQEIGHRPLLSLGVLLMVVGIQLVCTGLIAELLIYLMRNNNKASGKSESFVRTISANREQTNE